MFKSRVKVFPENRFDAVSHALVNLIHMLANFEPIEKISQGFVNPKPVEENNEVRFSFIQGVCFNQYYRVSV